MSPTTESAVTIEEEAAALRPRPFLKWAGGKKQLLGELLPRMPEQYGRYFEPFAGGGALFFSLTPKEARLSEINVELVNAYTVVRDQVEDLIVDLKTHRHDEDYYYALRNLDREPGYTELSPVHRASRLIYLNKSCFNGLYRVNSKGQFNVPFGDYKNPKIVDEENLRSCSAVLSGVEISCESFLSVEDHAVEGDFVYFDPPYFPVSDTAYFTDYSASGFAAKEHIELAKLCRRLDEKGVKFMLSNSYVDFVLGLYENFRTERVKASRAINSKADRRGKVYEVIVRNY